MQKLIFFLLFLTGIAFGRDVIVVSIPMQKEFVEKIVGDAYEVVSLVTQGVEPHDFEPKPSEIKLVNRAVAYFTIGIEFEEIWLPRFVGQNPRMQIFRSDANIAKINFAGDSIHTENHNEGDTHIWLSVKNAKQIAQNIYDGIMKLEEKRDFRESYQALIDAIDAVDKQIQEILHSLPKRQKFVVFHPMLGYFAKDYGLEEVSIEIEGKSPKMRDMIAIIESIKKEKLQIIFVQPEFSTKEAEFIAKESGAKLGYFSPLQTPWGESLIKFVKTLAEEQK